MTRPRLLAQFWKMGFALTVLTFACSAAAEPNAALNLEFPVRCKLGEDCFIQNYVDHDPGPGRLDFQCGQLSYDAHTGTDIRLRDLTAMRAGFAVLAAATGIVVGVRDGEPDMYYGQRDPQEINRKAAGNGVRIQHPGGWETQYSHLKQGSIRVRIGQHVRSGDILGEVGLSGKTEFPHLDFIVRKGGKIYDPFVPESLQGVHTLTLDKRCDKPMEHAQRSLGKGLWVHDLPYQPIGLLTTGFTNEIPTHTQAQAGRYQNIPLSAVEPRLSYWFEFFGIQPGDSVRLNIIGPDNKMLRQSQNIAEKYLAVLFGFVSLTSREPWPSGEYRAELSVTRQGREVLAHQHKALIP